jgi:hypothetical protein
MAHESTAASEFHIIRVNSDSEDVNFHEYVTFV